MREPSTESPYRRRESVAAPAAAIRAAGTGSAAAPGAETEGDTAGNGLAAIIPSLREVMTPAPTCVAPEASVLQLVRLLHA